MHPFIKTMKAALLNPIILDRPDYRRLISEGEIGPEDLACPAEPLPFERHKEVAQYIDEHGFLLRYPAPAKSCFGTARFRADGSQDCANCPHLVPCDKVVDRRLDFAGRGKFERLIRNFEDSRLATDLSNIAYWFGWVRADRKAYRAARNSESAAKAADAQSIRLDELNRANQEIREMDKSSRLRMLFTTYAHVEEEYDQHGIFNRFMDLQASSEIDNRLRGPLSNPQQLLAISTASEAVERIYGKDYNRHTRDTALIASAILKIPKSDAFRKTVERTIKAARLLKCLDILP